MILAWLIVIPMAGGLLAWLAGSRRPSGCRWISLVALLADLAAALTLFGRHGGPADWHRTMTAAGPPWIARLDLPWIPQIGIRFHLAVDGFSLVLVLLTVFLGMAALASAWTEIRERAGFFYFNLMWVLSGITGVFLAMDLFLFYFFWEMMLIPMYFIIAIWGHERRIYAAIKFFLFTQISGLFMLVAIIGLYVVHGQAGGVYTFDYPQLLGTAMPAGTAMLLMLGFLSAFVVKLPAFPFHTWLPDAHTQAPTPGSVILAGLLLKTGAYGLVRFIVPLFPEAAAAFAPIAMGMGIAGILYGALLAFSQRDLKRLVAYTSVSHMGFVLLGVFAWNALALQGVVMQIVCHGVSTGALFMIAGALQQRLHTRDMRRMGGMWAEVPRLAGVSLLFALASLGLPGLGNFVAEILILLGTWRVSVPAAVSAALGLISAALYALRMVQLTFYGPPRSERRPEPQAESSHSSKNALENLPGKRTIPDLSVREAVVMGAMIAVILWLGLFPRPLFDAVRPALRHLRQETAGMQRKIDAAHAALRPEPRHAVSGSTPTNGGQ